MVPRSSTRTAPSSMGGAVTGWTEPERRVHRTGLSRLGARVEPVPMPHFLGAEWRGEVAVRPIHLARDERVGSHPIGRRGPAIVHIAHERGPGGRDDFASTRVVL